MSRLKKRLIDSTRPDPNKEIRLWDDDPRGLGIRIKPSGTKSFFVQYRSPEDFKKCSVSSVSISKRMLDITLENAEYHDCLKHRAGR